MIIRKNINSLTSDEKRAFVQAIKALKAINYNWYPVTHARVMSEMVGSDGQNGAHAGPIFLPWHRKFIREFEKDLQRQNFELGLPYWDWTQDSGIWDEDFMGGDGDPDDRGIVKSGPFRWNPPNGWSIIQLDDNGRVIVDDAGNVKQYELERRFGKFTLRLDDGTSEILNVTLPTRQEVEEAVKVIPYDSPDWHRYTDPTRSFRSKLEGWDIDIKKSHLHNVVHRWVSGSMVTALSPSDPVFFLHHSNIDRIWARWQDEHPNEKYPKHGEITDRKTGKPIKYYNLYDQLYPWEDGSTIESVWDYRKLGYEYDKYD